MGTTPEIVLKAKEKSSRHKEWDRLQDELFTELDQLRTPGLDNEEQKINLEDDGFQYNIVFFKSGNYLGLKFESEHMERSLVYLVDRKAGNAFITNFGETDEQSLFNEALQVATLEQLHQFKELIGIYKAKKGRN